MVGLYEGVAGLRPLLRRDVGKTHRARRVGREISQTLSERGDLESAGALESRRGACREANAGLLRVDGRRVRMGTRVERRAGQVVGANRTDAPPEPSARDRGSSLGSRFWPASAADSPPCSRNDTPSPSSSAGGAGCGGRAGIIARSADTYVVFGWSSVGSLRPPMMSRPRPISLPVRARRRRRSRREEDRFQ